MTELYHQTIVRYASRLPWKEFQSSEIQRRIKATLRRRFARRMMDLIEITISVVAA